MTREKKIAFFIPKRWPLANVKVAEEFKKRFADHQVDVIEVESLVLKNAGAVARNILATVKIYGADILLKRHAFKDAFWRTPFIFNYIRNLIRKNYSTKEYRFTFQMQSLFDCSLEGTPHFLYTDHTHLTNLDYASFNVKKLYPKAWTDLERTIYNHATLNFVRSTNIQNSLREQYHQAEEKVICVFAGGNVDTSAPNMDAGRFAKQAILFVGIDWNRKGGPALLVAFKIARQTYPNATLTVVGCRPKINVENCVAVGKIMPDNLKRYYQEASIFCMPTREEPFGISYLEAMRAGLPVIGTQIGSIPDFIHDGENGFLVQPNDAQSIAEALKSLLANPEQCRRFGMKSLEIIERQYTWRAVCEKLHFYIEKSLENS